MKAIVIEKPGADFTLVERPISDPGEGTVRIKVAACGVCHSDSYVKEGYWPGLTYPRSTGHEVAGVIDAVGPGVTGWSVGDRVGIGWHGDNCGQCDPCRRGDFMNCIRFRITGFDFDGGYEQYMIAPVRGLARIPDGLGFAEAGPLLCAGVTTFNSLRHSRAMAGDSHSRHRRAGPPGCAVRAALRIPRGGHFKRQRQAGARRETGRSPLPGQRHGERGRRTYQDGRRQGDCGDRAE